MGSTSSKNERDELKTQIKHYNDELQRTLIGSGQAKKTFMTLSDLWCTSRKETVDIMTRVANTMNEHHRNVNIANLGGVSSCIAGGTAGIASIVLAPVSGGASLALAAGGIFSTVAGSATVLAANVVEVCLTKELMEEVQKALDTDSIYTNALRAAFKEVIIHENEVLKILSTIKMVSSEYNLGQKKHISHGIDQRSELSREMESVENLIKFLTCFFNDDNDFLQQLKKTEYLIKETPTVSATVPNSSDFFQALKEVSSIAPESLKRISEAAVQSSTTISASAQSVSIGTQMVAISLGAIFVALDVYHLAKTSKNFDEGSKTELAEKIKDAVIDLQKELEKVTHLNTFFKSFHPME